MCPICMLAFAREIARRTFSRMFHAVLRSVKFLALDSQVCHGQRSCAVAVRGGFFFFYVNLYEVLRRENYSGCVSVQFVLSASAI